MAKRFVAFLMVLVLGLSMVALSAQAEPANPDCQHPSKEYRSTITREPYNATQHYVVVRRVLVCKICNDEVALPTITKTLEAHTCYWTDEHISSRNVHRFQKICRYCKQALETHELYCTGAPHVANPYD